MKTIAWLLLISIVIFAGCSQNFDIPSLISLQYDDTKTDRSVFENDTCEPPCWFGLVVNQSDNDSMLDFIESSTQYFQDWKLPANITNGVYTFYWTSSDRPERQLPNNSILIEDGTIKFIEILPNKVVHLREVLLRYGMPDRIRFSPRLAHELFLVLIYDELSIYVTVRNLNDGCNIANIQDEFYVYSVIYRDTKVHFPRDRYVEHLLLIPKITWNNWLTEGANIACSDIDTSQFISPTTMPMSKSSE